MSRDQIYGAIFLLVSLAAAIAYVSIFVGGAMGITFLKDLQGLAIAVPVALAVLAVLVIIMWIGWTMLTTPPLEEISPPQPTGSPS
jgi:hypothetical protein